MSQADNLTDTYRLAAPIPRALVTWPNDFGSRFTVFVDTEEEFDWKTPLTRDRHGVSAIFALPEAHRRFAERGVPLTYMVDYPIVVHEVASDILRAVTADGISAIGAQLHPWVQPPFEEAVTLVNSFAGNLPKALEAEKIDVLTSAIAQVFGRAPLAFRTGRYGVGRCTLKILAARGYKIDSSMRARYSYASEGGPDFTAIGNDAFRVDGLVELPLTTIYTGRLRYGGTRLYRSLGSIPGARGLFARTGLLSRVALTPEDMPIADALEAVAVAVGEGVRVLNFSFHSPSLVPGHTPYVRDATDLAAFHQWWDRMLDNLVRRGVRAASLDELIAGCPT